MIPPPSSTPPPIPPRPAPRPKNDLATTVNGPPPLPWRGPAADLGIPLRPYVHRLRFPGDGVRPWQPGDPLPPLGAYGRSKLKGRMRPVRAAGGAPCDPAHVMGQFSAHLCHNFVKTMLRLGADRDKLTMVPDQIGGPTPAPRHRRGLPVDRGSADADPTQVGHLPFLGLRPTRPGPISRARSSRRRAKPVRSRTSRPAPIPRPRSARSIRDGLPRDGCHLRDFPT